jgi:phage-related holin
VLLSKWAHTATLPPLAGQNIIMGTGMGLEHILCHVHATCFLVLRAECIVLLLCGAVRDVQSYVLSDMVLCSTQIAVCVCDLGYVLRVSYCVLCAVCCVLCTVINKGDLLFHELKLFGTCHFFPVMLGFL